MNQFSNKLTPPTLDYLIELSNVSSIENLWDLHCKMMASFGFDRLIFGFTRFRTEQSLGDPNDFLLLSNHDPEYFQKFIGDGHYNHAPMVHWAQHNEGFCSWSLLNDMVQSGTLTQSEKRVLEFNVQNKVTAGYTISFKSVSKRTKGAIALTAKEGMSQVEVDAMWEDHGKTIVLMNNLVYLKIITLPYTPSNQTLTKRQKEALEWVGDGKTMQDIAQIMGLTQATIEKHLRLARESLNVDTTAQAVLKAAFQNQMFVVEA